MKPGDIHLRNDHSLMHHFRDSFENENTVCWLGVTIVIAAAIVALVFISSYLSVR